MNFELDLVSCYYRFPVSPARHSKRVLARLHNNILHSHRFLIHHRRNDFQVQSVHRQSDFVEYLRLRKPFGIVSCQLYDVVANFNAA